MVRYGATASIRMVRTQSATSESAMSAMGPNTPAALTRMVGAPKRARDLVAQRRDGGRVRDVARRCRSRSPGRCPRRASRSRAAGPRCGPPRPRSRRRREAQRHAPAQAPATAGDDRDAARLVSHRWAPSTSRVSRWNTSRSGVESTMPSSRNSISGFISSPHRSWIGGVPEPVPGALVRHLGVQEQDRVVLEDGHLGDALASISSTSSGQIWSCQCRYSARPPGLRRIVNARRIMASTSWACRRLSDRLERLAGVDRVQHLVVGRRGAGELQRTGGRGRRPGCGRRGRPAPAARWTGTGRCGPRPRAPG